jgi:hypothetical protein
VHSCEIISASFLGVIELLVDQSLCKIFSVGFNKPLSKDGKDSVEAITLFTRITTWSNFVNDASSLFDQEISLFLVWF